MTLGKALRDKDVEIFWLVGFVEEAERGWQVLTVTRSMDTGALTMSPLPIGLLPLLAPGRVYLQGHLTKALCSGRMMQLRIDDVGAGEEVTTAVIPSKVYAFDGRRRGIQRLFRYRQGERVVLVPAVEMIRYLFLHNKTMANALMRPSGIMAFYSPEEPGFHPNLHLRFTRRMPRACLSDAFAAEFSWLAVSPEGRHSWDSVRERTAGRKYVSFTPPRLMDTRWLVRAVEWGETVLVLEILSMTGKCFPCNVLRYSHPSIRETKQFHRIGAKPFFQSESGTTATAEPVNAYEPEIDTTAIGSRTNSRQTALHVPAKLGTFDRMVPIERIMLKARPTAEAADDTTAREPSQRLRDRRHPYRLRTPVSVAETASSNAVPPVEFHLLEPAGADDIGGLVPMMSVIQLMAGMLPTVHVNSSLCLLKPGRAFSLNGRRRRFCLIAIFTPENAIPLVLMSVDHSGEHALSSLALTYRHPCSFQEIEVHLAALLNGLVDNGGHWDMGRVTDWIDLVAVRRFPRVLRCRDRLADEDYLLVWATKLGIKLGLIVPN